MCMRIGRLLLLLQLLLALIVAGLLMQFGNWGVTSALVGGVLVSLAVHALVVTIEFGLAIVSSSTAPPGHWSGPAGWLKALFSEIRASVMTFSVRQPLFGDSALASAGDRAHRIPIVFVHGFFCNRAMWRPAARWFAARGHAIDSVNLEPVYGSIDQYPPIIDEAVRRLCERTGQTRVALVCHSMGGLAARAYARDYGLDRVARVITLGTPHQGTFLARFGHGRNTAQMRLSSQWLGELERRERSKHRARFTIVLSHHDNIVSPQAIQVLPDARVIETSGKGHVQLALDPFVWSIVADELA